MRLIIECALLEGLCKIHNWLSFSWRVWIWIKLSTNHRKLTWSDRNKILICSSAWVMHSGKLSVILPLKINVCKTFKRFIFVLMLQCCQFNFQFILSNFPWSCEKQPFLGVMCLLVIWTHFRSTSYFKFQFQFYYNFATTVKIQEFQ